MTESKSAARLHAKKLDAESIDRRKDKRASRLAEILLNRLLGLIPATIEINQYDHIHARLRGDLFVFGSKERRIALKEAAEKFIDAKKTEWTNIETAMELEAWALEENR